MHLAVSDFCDRLRSAMSRKVSLVLALVALHISGRAPMAWVRTSPTSHARLGRLLSCSRGLGGFLPLWLDLLTWSTDKVALVLLPKSSWCSLTTSLWLLHGEIGVQLHPLRQGLIMDADNISVTDHLIW